MCLACCLFSVRHAFLRAEHPPFTYPLKVYLQQRWLKMTFCYHALTLASFRKGCFSSPPQEAALLNNTQGKPNMKGWRFSTLVLAVAVRFVLFPSFGSLLQTLVPSQSLLFHNYVKVQNLPMTNTLAQWPLSWCNIFLPSRENRKI